MLGGKEEVLTFKAVGNNATREKVGDAALFEAQADWLKTTSPFDAVIKEITIQGIYLYEHWVQLSERQR